jgi:hypothetical protein
MSTRRKRRRLFNAFAFALLAVALYLIAFKKENYTEQFQNISSQQHSSTTPDHAAVH